MRFSKKRSEFTNEPRSMIDRDGGEGNLNPDAKPKNIKLPPKDILVLDIGL
mgnify:FL=1